MLSSCDPQTVRPRAFHAPSRYADTRAAADSTQYTDGVTGALVVHPASPPPEAFPTWDEELVVQLADLYHTFSSVLLASYLSVSLVPARPLRTTFFFLSVSAQTGLEFSRCSL